MQIKFLTTSAGPRGNYEAGRVYHVAPDFAADLIANNYAVSAEDPAPITAEAAALARHKATEQASAETKPASAETNQPETEPNAGQDETGEQNIPVNIHQPETPPAAATAAANPPAQPSPPATPPRRGHHQAPRKSKASP